MKDCGRPHPAINSVPYIYPKYWTNSYCQCDECAKAQKEQVDEKPISDGIWQDADSR